MALQSHACEDIGKVAPEGYHLWCSQAQQDAGVVSIPL